MWPRVKPVLPSFVFTSSAGCWRDFCKPHHKNVAAANKRDSNPPLPSLRFLPFSHSHHYVQGTDPVLKSRNLTYAAFRQTPDTA
jgi:hypothetical protein